MTPIPPAVSVITLAVRDISRSAAFYERLGWLRSSRSQEAIAFFATSTCVVALYGDEALADDAGVRPSKTVGFRGVTLAINLPSQAAVDTAYQAALDAGATSLVEPAGVFWGGYHAYIADPDGHAWEYAHNPHWPVDDTGRVSLPD
jgi:predicted lactoylglutathione lyase